MSRTALVLFDVDGTLLVTGGASSRCIRCAAEGVWGEAFRWGELTPGLLDPELIRTLASRCGIDVTSDQISQYKSRYIVELATELAARRQDVRVLPGVRELIDRLQSRAGVAVGVLTGNFRDATRLKLDAAGLAMPMFPIMACAEDGRRRCDLVPAALRQLAALTGVTAKPEHVILVGDTPKDVQCAREAGCRVLAVATGRYTLRQLRPHAPDRLVADLTDPTALEDLIEQAAA